MTAEQTGGVHTWKKNCDSVCTAKHLYDIWRRHDACDVSIDNSLSLGPAVEKLFWLCFASGLLPDYPSGMHDGMHGTGADYNGPSQLDYLVGPATKKKPAAQVSPTTKADDDWGNESLGDDLLPM